MINLTAPSRQLTKQSTRSILLFVGGKKTKRIRSPRRVRLPSLPTTRKGWANRRVRDFTKGSQYVWHHRLHRQ
jgi:hypothetical protein